MSVVAATLAPRAPRRPKVGMVADPSVRTAPAGRPTSAVADLLNSP